MRSTADVRARATAAADTPVAPNTPAIPAAASAALTDLLTGPPRRGVVRGVLPPVVYLEVDGGPAAETVAVETPDALRLPCAVVVPLPRTSMPFVGVRVGDVATAGDGMVQAGPLRLRVARWWRPRLPRPIRPGDELARRAAVTTGRLPVLEPELRGRLRLVIQALRAGDVARAAPPAAGLVGRGSGLTPAGDDVLAGLLCGLWAGPATSAGAELWAGLRGRLGGTSTLSATLLRHAVEGRAIPQVTDLVDALGGRGDPAAAADRLVAVGHSSGAALAHGVVAAAHVVLATDPTTEVAR